MYGKKQYLLIPYSGEKATFLETRSAGMNVSPQSLSFPNEWFGNVKSGSG
jgi:hypothetical protein